MKYPDVPVNFLIFEGIVQSIKCYQKKLCLYFDVNYNLGDALVWKCKSRSEVTFIYLFMSC